MKNTTEKVCMCGLSESEHDDRSEPVHTFTPMDEYYNKRGSCSVCGALDSHEHDHQSDGSGLDDGPYLPGCAPRKKPEPKSTGKMRDIRVRSWATRRDKYGPRGHR